MEPVDLTAMWQRILGDQPLETLHARATCRPVVVPPDGHTMVPDWFDEATPDFSHLEGQAGATMVPAGEDEVSLSMPAPPSGTAAAGGIVLGALLGEGGAGRVHVTEQRALHREVAVKVVHAAAAQRNFVAESRITGALDHPNVLPVHDLVTLEDGTPALIMKRVTGRSWAEHLDLVRGRETFDLVDEVHTLEAVCQGVAFAHDRGVLHLDLKPDNIMVGTFGEVLVMDWGCAVVADDERWASQPGLPRASWIRGPFGTPSYMPPELALGESARIGPRSDVYLLGGILYKLLTGRPPRGDGAVARIIADAAAGTPPPRPRRGPEPLIDLAMHALSADPQDRPATVLAFRDRLHGWLTTRESRHIAEQSLKQMGELESGAAVQGETIEERLLELVGAFQQARVLWPDNPDVADGEARARRLLARRAIERGEPGLAEAQLRHLDPQDPHRDVLQAQAQAVRQARARTRRQARTLRWGLGAAIATTLLTAAVGLVMVERARREASNNAQVAAARLDEVMQLADHQHVAELLDEAKALWPAETDNVPSLEAWLDRSRIVIADRAQHERALDALGPAGDQDSIEVRWRRDLLADLVVSLRDLQERVVPDVTRRLEQARSLHARSVQAHAEAWRAAAQAVALDPRFDGLVLQPQLGLVPLGADPHSGLQEFAHLPSGTAPTRGPYGQLDMAEQHGVVLVLVPPGQARMGASLDRGSLQFDALAKDTEVPLHVVPLDAFLLAKYELTQAQWQRIMGSLPSAYPIGHEVGGHTITGTHPVEQITWSEAREAMRRLGLTLPTEAQWEYAARAGTHSAYWTGDTPNTLQGAANLADRWARDHGGPESWRYDTFLDDGYLTHAPIGGYRANPFGLHDTAGNVWEWCLDRYGAYTLPTEPGTGARHVEGPAPRLFRGGGFRATVAHARSADRYSLYAEDYRAYDVGIRPARRLDRRDGPE